MMRNLHICLMVAAVVVALGASVATAQITNAGAAPAITLERGPVSLEQAFKLKAKMGEAAFGAGVKAAVDALNERTERTDRCATRAETAASAQMELVRRTPDPQTARKSKVAADAALVERENLRPLYLGDAVAPAPYGSVRNMVANAKAATDPRLAKLYRLMAEDQFAHIDSVTVRPFLGQGVHTTWEKGLDEAGLTYVNTTISSEWCPIKIAAVAWLKADLKQHGWYTVSNYGAAADRAAWLIVQHSRHDLAFQKDVLAMLEPLWQSGETKAENFAMLYDQTAYYEGRPGRFGVTGNCTAPGVWTPAPVEDRGAVDDWRKKAGMPPLAEYVTAKSRACTN